MGIDEFLSRLPWDEMAAVAAPFFDGDHAAGEAFVRTLQGEAKLGLELVRPRLRPGMRVLEVGAGMGLLSAYLASTGVDVVALEPGLGGFGVNAALARAADFRDLRRLEIPAGRLDGMEFDLVYSINVLEHIPDLPAALRGMARVLAADGLMVHTCPNYLVPFEPHFGIVLVPGMPRLTAALRPRLRTSELWQSLNFVTLPRLRRMAAAEGLDVRFEEGLLRRAFERLETDEAFRERQGGGLVGMAYRMLKATGTFPLLGALPAVLATPMVFELRHRAR